MSADTLLAHLDGVKHTGPGRWLARCPSHEDRLASLSIRELDDGRVLVHCFAECSTEEVLGACGLTFEALYPERLPGNYTRRERRPFNAYDVLEAVAGESLIVAVAAGNIAQGVELTDEDRARVTTAGARISAALEVCRGG